MPRGVPIAAGFIAAVGAGIGLVFAAIGGGSPSPPTPQLGAGVPSAGVDLPAAPTSTATDNGAVAGSATPNPDASAGTSSSRPSHPSASRGATPQPSAPQSSAGGFSVPQSSGQPSAPDATQGPGTTPTSIPTTVVNTPTPPPPTSPTSTSPAVATCHVTWTVVHSWTGGFQLGFTVSNSGSVPTNGWTVGYSWPSGQTATDIWDASATQNGALVKATNLSYDGAIPAGGSVTFGMLGNGNLPSTLPGLQCNAL